MLERLALWLADRTGRVIAAIAITCAALSAYAGVWLAAVIILALTAYTLGLAWDQDAAPDRRNG